VSKGKLKVFAEKEMADRLPIHQTAWQHYLGFGVTQEDLDRGLAGYSGSVSYVDEMIGHLVDSLGHMDYLEDTLIVYSSDHGDMAGAHGLWHKQLFYEESARVPLIFAGSGVGEGEVRDEVVNLVDLFPTFCEISGLEVPDHCDGVSLGLLLKGGGVIEDRVVFSEIVFQGEHWRGCMARWKQWKYCWYVGDHEELYNLDDDPSEEVNLAGREDVREIHQRLRSALLDWWKPNELEARVQALPTTTGKDKHFWPFQHVLADGRWIDAWP